MPRPRYLLMTRRMTWWGMVLTAWDLWRRIPKQHRRRIRGEVRRHAPRVARGMAREVRRARAVTRSGRS